MKPLFYVSVILVATGEVLERADFFGETAEEQANTWAQNKRAQGESANMIYGPDQERDIVIEDKTGEHTKKLEIEDRKEAREFCLWVIDAIAAYNKKYKSPTDMITMFSTPAMQGIMLALLTGSTQTARNLIAQVGPLYYPADFVAGMLVEMDKQLVKENPPVEEPEETEDPPADNGDENSQEPDDGNETEDESSSDEP